MKRNGNVSDLIIQGAEKGSVIWEVENSHIKNDLGKKEKLDQRGGEKSCSDAPKNNGCL